ncbi:conserved hypothetical protein [Pedosphaera parvula Ellin514]|uniref:DUF748 domain-containing protein n=2 Tax=Pedosphaera TaxID=1032526 RepID=B9XPB3_PEDPL|nr:conserved hypothetical protein [Pedosphaera parvula Ellin514]
MAAGDDSKPGAATDGSHRPKPSTRLRRWRIFLLILILILILGVGRAFLPSIVRDYVNRTLDRNPLYSGRIGDVQIHLLRGAYSIQDIRLSKTTGNIPVPLFAAKRVEFALQWNALVHRRIVGRVLMEEPELNFVDAPDEGESQSGAGGPWLQLIRDLFPFTINRAVIQNGSAHFRAYQKKEPVDVYLSQLDATIDNLGNIHNQTTPLVSTIQANALVMDQAKLELKMTLDPFSYKPTFHLVLRLMNLDVVKINNLALAYGKFDFKRGWFDLVVEADSKEGQLHGYVKPLFRDLKVFSLTHDLKEDNVLQFFWQALVGVVTTVFKNQPHDQFGTLIPFSAEASGRSSTDILATLGNLLRNAFVRAYLPKLEGGQEEYDGLQFGPPDLTDPISAGDPP